MSVAKPWMPALPAPATSHSVWGEPALQFSTTIGFGLEQSAAATAGEPPSAAATSRLDSATRATDETDTDPANLDRKVPPPPVRRSLPNIGPDNGATPRSLPRCQT